ncbi:MAG: ABC transporter ATP-binding protein [Chloroflexales bacterium]|nr:ABC transporter ATP-binding protein [Chloroflexales bacterium]
MTANIRSSDAYVQQRLLAVAITMGDFMGAVRTVTDLMVGYNGCIVVDHLSLRIARGGITALAGPNGSGKSTLLKALARLLNPSAGAVYLDDRAITSMPTQAVARKLAILPQGPVAPAGLTVAELVEQGRYPHAGPLRMLRRRDHSAIREALALTDTTQFAHRPT